jgi:hypothetical protein
MASRLSAIRTAVQAHITTGFTAAGTVTFSDTPVLIEDQSADLFPFAVTVFEEAEPERLAFKQERRRVVGRVVVGILVAAGVTVAATREAMDLAIEGTRDAIFGDETLTSTVDDVLVTSGTAYSSADDSIVYGEFEIETEEVF